MPAKPDVADAPEANSNFREFSRDAVKIQADLLVSQGYRFKVSVLDLSPAGFRIETANAIALNEKVYLTIPGFHPLQARVAWSHRENYGCEFSQRLYPSVFLHISSAFPSLVSGDDKRQSDQC